MPKISITLDFEPEECSAEDQEKIANSPELLMRLLPTIWNNSLQQNTTILQNGVQFNCAYPANTIVHKLKELIERSLS